MQCPNSNCRVMPAYYKVGGIIVSAAEVSGLSERQIPAVDRGSGGCTLGNPLPKQLGGDSLIFTVGPQWIIHTPAAGAHTATSGSASRKSPEESSEVKRKRSRMPTRQEDMQISRPYTRRYERTGFSMSLGGGLDMAQ